MLWMLVVGVVWFGLGVWAEGVVGAVRARPGVCDRRMLVADAGQQRAGLVRLFTYLTCNVLEVSLVACVLLLESQMPRAKRDGSRGVVAGIDRRIAELDENLESVPEWMAERRSLLAARKELTGEPISSPPPGLLPPPASRTSTRSEPGASSARE